MYQVKLRRALGHEYRDSSRLVCVTLITVIVFLVSALGCLNITHDLAHVDTYLGH